MHKQTDITRFERTFGREAYCHLFVTYALQKFLVNEWHLQGRSVVLHDRPPSQFQHTEISAQLSVSWGEYRNDAY
jgi:beta-1,4-mannosyltransferase